MFAALLLGLWYCSIPVVSGAAIAPEGAQTKPKPEKVVVPAAAELRAAIDRGASFLLRSQNSNGWWSTSEQPAVTGLVLTTLNLEPSGRFQHNRSSELARAYDFILTSAKPDGSIQRTGLANYNTSLCLVALASADDSISSPSFSPRAATWRLTD